MLLNKQSKTLIIDWVRGKRHVEICATAADAMSHLAGRDDDGASGSGGRVSCIESDR